MTLDFNLDPEVTKELLLSKYSEETYMQYYLQVPIKKGLFCSPLREDKRPTCSFFKMNGTLYMKDFGTGKNYSFIDVVKTKYNVNYFQALKIIAKDFGIIGNYKVPKVQKIVPKLPESKTAEIQVEIKDYTKSELNWWKKFGITPDILNKFKVFSCKTIFLNGNKYVSSGKGLIFGYYGGKIKNLELWRIYFPKRTDKRFLTNWPSKKVQGYEQLPAHGNLLVITKSMKDVMSLYSFGIFSIAPNSENLFISDNMLKDLKTRFKHILVIYDQDRAGKYNLGKIRKKYPELNYFIIPKEYNSKDFSDLVNNYGRDKVKEFIKEFLTNYKFK